VLRGPGRYLLLMTWWIWVFLLIDLLSHSLRQHLLSFLAYLVFFFCTAGTALVLNRLEARMQRWSRSALAGRLLILAISYTAAMLASLCLTAVLDSRSWLSYFGREAEASFGFLTLHSIVLYWVLGLTVGGVAGVLRRRAPSR